MFYYFQSIGIGSILSPNYITNFVETFGNLYTLVPLYMVLKFLRVREVGLLI